MVLNFIKYEADGHDFQATGPNVIEVIKKYPLYTYSDQFDKIAMYWEHLEGNLKLGFDFWQMLEICQLELLQQHVSGYALGSEDKEDWKTSFLLFHVPTGQYIRTQWDEWDNMCESIRFPEIIKAFNDMIQFATDKKNVHIPKYYFMACLICKTPTAQSICFNCYQNDYKGIERGR